MIWLVQFVHHRQGTIPFVYHMLPDIIHKRELAGVSGTLRNFDSPYTKR